MRTLLAAAADESRLVFLDAGVLIITVLAVVVYAFFYPVPYLNQVMRDVPIVVVDEDHSGLSRRLVRMADEHQALRVAAAAASAGEAAAMVTNGSVAGVLVIPRDFEREVLLGRQARLSGHIDASYLLTYNTVLGALLETSGTLSAGVEVARLRAAGMSQRRGDAGAAAGGTGPAAAVQRHVRLCALTSCRPCWCSSSSRRCSSAWAWPEARVANGRQRARRPLSVRATRRSRSPAAPFPISCSMPPTPPTTSTSCRAITATTFPGRSGPWPC